AVEAGSKMSSSAKAQPAAVTSGGTDVGVGASVSVHVVNTTTLAGAQDDAGLTDAKDVSVKATDTQTVLTEAKTAVGKSATAVTPSVAVAVSNATVDASV